MAGELDVLLGNSFLAAASIAYYGPFTGTYRQELVQCWKAECKKYEIPHSEDYSLQKILGNQIEIRDWQSKSLSSDSISVNNAILI
jgi:dynein heavy chain